MFPSALPLATVSLQSQFDPVTALSPLVGGDPTTFANPVLRQQLQQLGLSPAGFGGAWAGPQLPITAGAGGIASLGGITSPLGVGSQIGGLAGLGGNVSGFGSPLTHGMFPSHWLVHPAQATGQFQQQRFLGQMHPLQQQMLQQGGAGWPAVSPLSQYSLVQQQLAQRNAMLGGIGGLGNITGLGGIGGLGIGGYGIGGYGIGGYGIGGYGIGGYGGAAIATEAQELAKDLMIDRSRDSRNLGIIVDLVDARSHARQADVLLNALSQGVPVAPQAVVQALASDRQMDQATDSLIRTTINDAKYNRRTDEILSNVVVGRPHVRRADEVAKNAKDDAFDCMLEQQAGALLAAAAQVNPWVGRTRARQQIIAVRDIMAPSMLSGPGGLQTLLTFAPAAMMLRAAGLGNANVIESITGSGAALPTIAAGFGGGFGGLGQAGALGAWTV